MLYYFLEKKLHKTFKEYVERETKYNVSETLGMGSYGVAYLLIHKHTKEKVVMKRLRAKHRKSTKTRSKFRQEIDMLKSIQLSNVPTVLDEGELNHIPFYMMEYVDGHTFEYLIFEGNQQFSEAESLQITQQLLEIVMSLHSKGIVHRDLRIPNILICNERLHIIDFGLSTYMKENNDIHLIKNPKRAENHISDLYYIGHFLLYLLYSNYKPSNTKERSWQEELQLSDDIRNFIERLLLIQPAFSSTAEASEAILQRTKAQAPPHSTV